MKVGKTITEKHKIFCQTELNLNLNGVQMIHHTAAGINHTQWCRFQPDEVVCLICIILVPRMVDVMKTSQLSFHNQCQWSVSVKTRCFGEYQGTVIK